MKIRTLLVTALTVTTVAITSGQEILLNGDFSSAFSFNGNGNHVYGDNFDQGWVVKTNDPTPTSGSAVWAGTTVTLLEDALSQVTSIGAQSGGSLNLTFDWTASDANFLSVEYQVFGLVMTGSVTLTGSQQIVKGTNGNGKTLAGVTTDGSNFLQVYDLLNSSNGGNGNAGTGNLTASFGTFAADSASTLKSANVAIDLSSFAGTLDDVSDYDYIGVRFHIAGVQVVDGATGSSLDNVSLSAVPEPSSLALFGGLGALGFVVSRRRR